MINPISKTNFNYQRWSTRGRPWPQGCPRGHILKSLASKVKSLAFTSKPQFFGNCPVLGRKLHYFLKRPSFAGKRQKPCGIFAETFFCFFSFLLLEIAWKKFLNTIFIFFWRSYENFFSVLFFQVHLRLCPWSLALASSILFPGLERVCPRKVSPWPWPHIFFVSFALGSSLVLSTPPLLTIPNLLKCSVCDVRCDCNR